MKALSIRAPWWWFILYCGKDIENRDWPTRFRGTVLLHASTFWIPSEISDDFDIALGIYQDANRVTLSLDLTEPEQQASTLQLMRSRRGCIVGKVDIVDCVTRSSSPWFFGKYGFVLRNPVAFAKPIPYRGALMFFDVPMNLIPPDPAQLVSAGQASLFSN